MRTSLDFVNLARHRRRHHTAAAAVRVGDVDAKLAALTAALQRDGRVYLAS